MLAVALGYAAGASCFGGLLLTICFSNRSFWRRRRSSCRYEMVHQQHPARGRVPKRGGARRPQVKPLAVMAAAELSMLCQTWS